MHTWQGKVYLAFVDWIRYILCSFDVLNNNNNNNNNNKIDNKIKMHIRQGKVYLAVAV